MSIPKSLGQFVAEYARQRPDDVIRIAKPIHSKFEITAIAKRRRYGCCWLRHSIRGTACLSGESDNHLRWALPVPFPHPQHHRTARHAN